MRRHQDQPGHGVHPKKQPLAKAETKGEAGDSQSLTGVSASEVWLDNVGALLNTVQVERGIEAL